MKKVLTLGLLTIASLSLAACDIEADTKHTQAKKAEEAANSINFSENSEIENIKHRLELTSKPGLLGYIALTNRVGQIVLYAPVKGKITSGSKRLTKPYDRCRVADPNCMGDNNVEAPSDEGTYGSSNPYIYFWTSSGQYIQTDLDYVYSDKPLRLKEPAIVDLTVN